ncbi:MAG: hypothetical protein SynsKO_02810 [Synoicihabitans sp.]
MLNSLRNSRRLTSVLVAFLFVVSISEARIVRETSDRFTVQAGGELLVSTQGGDIEIQSGEGNEVVVLTRIDFPRADSDAEADEMMDNLELTIEQTDRGIRAEAKNLTKPSGWFSWGGPKRVSVSFSIVVPENYHVDARTSGGDINLINLGGIVSGRTSGGDVLARDIDGPVEVHTSGGDIEVFSATGEVAAHTSGGNIRVRGVDGPVKASTSGGDVHIEEVHGTVRATTSGGNVSARLLGPLLADALLSTSGGNVSATVSESISFRLDARTSGGNVKSSGISIQIDSGGVGKTKLAGDVNGGGHTLKLRTSGGNVRLNTI